LIYNEGDMDHPWHGIVSVQIDANPPFQFEMTSDGFPDAPNVELSAFPPQFLEQLMQGRKMDVSKDGQVRTFSLAGTHRALSMLAACVFDIREEWRQHTRD
jgi:hypothetical protein